MPTLAEVEAVARGAAPPPLGGIDRERIDAARAVVEAAVSSGEPVYGVTTGFGQLASVRVSSADAARLQVNLLRSHAVGAGPPLEPEVVRGMLLLLAASLRRGHSGTRPQLVELVLGLLERGVLPVVPSRGSVGSSGTWRRSRTSRWFSSARARRRSPAGGCPAQMRWRKRGSSRSS